MEEGALFSGAAFVISFWGGEASSSFFRNFSVRYAGMMMSAFFSIILSFLGV